MMRWIFGSIGAGVWSSVVFAIGMMFAFPSDWVKDQISYQVQSQSRKKMLVHIGEVSWSGLMGVSLENLTLFQSKPGRRKPGQKERPARVNTPLVSLEALTLKPKLFSLLGGSLATEVNVALPGGEVETSFGFSKSQFQIGTEIQGFDLAAHPIESEGNEVALSGALNLLTDLVIDREDIKNSSGDLELTVDNLALIKGMIGGFELTEMAFSEAILQMKVNDGKAEVTKGSFIGDLIEATIEGHITLREDISRSRLALKIMVRFDDTLDKLAKIALKSSRDEDGVYHFKGQGTLMNPRFRADRVNQKRPSREASARDQDDQKDISTRTNPTTSRKDSVSDEDREERREKRRERLRKRRERMKKRREDRRERSTDREVGRSAAEDDRYDEIDERYEEDQRDNYPPPQLPPPQTYEQDVDPEYNNQGNANDYGDDPGEANGNMEDLGYIDE
jgi:type II secretion system protein N